MVVVLGVNITLESCWTTALVGVGSFACPHPVRRLQLLDEAADKRANERANARYIQVVGCWRESVIEPE